MRNWQITQKLKAERVITLPSCALLVQVKRAESGKEWVDVNGKEEGCVNLTLSLFCSGFDASARNLNASGKQNSWL